MARKYTLEFANQVVEMYRSGMQRSEIAEKMGIKPHTAYEIYYNYGQRAKNPKEVIISQHEILASEAPIFNTDTFLDYETHGYPFAF